MPATPADVPAMVAVALAAYRPYLPRLGGVEPPAMRPDFRSAVAAGLAWAARFDPGDGIGGYLLCAVDADPGAGESAGGGAWVIDHVALAPAWQGRGHGRRLMDFAEDEGRRRGHAEARLLTNLVMTENQAIYAARGYRETGRTTVLGGSQTRIHYAKPL
ncbi:MAG: GNAT family N-acetyltransferase [Pseudomonadota bacterium]